MGNVLRPDPIHVGERFRVVHQDDEEHRDLEARAGPDRQWRVPREPGVRFGPPAAVKGGATSVGGWPDPAARKAETDRFVLRHGEGISEGPPPRRYGATGPRPQIEGQWTPPPKPTSPRSYWPSTGAPSARRWRRSRPAPIAS